jgi:hypothetical protein
LRSWGGGEERREGGGEVRRDTLFGENSNSRADLSLPRAEQFHARVTFQIKRLSGLARPRLELVNARESAFLVLARNVPVAPRVSCSSRTWFVVIAALIRSKKKRRGEEMGGIPTGILASLVVPALALYLVQVALCDGFDPCGSPLLQHLDSPPQLALCHQPCEQFVISH